MGMHTHCVWSACHVDARIYVESEYQCSVNIVEIIEYDPQTIFYTAISFRVK